MARTLNTARTTVQTNLATPLAQALAAEALGVSSIGVETYKRMTTSLPSFSFVVGDPNKKTSEYDPTLRRCLVTIDMRNLAIEEGKHDWIVIYAVVQGPDLDEKNSKPTWTLFRGEELETLRARRAFTIPVATHGVVRLMKRTEDAGGEVVGLVGRTDDRIFLRMAAEDDFETVKDFVFRHGDVQSLEQARVRAQEALYCICPSHREHGVEVTLR